MKRKVIVLGLLTIASLFAVPSDYKKIMSYQIGPGTVYSYYEGTSRTWAIHLTEIDLTNPYIKLESVIGQDNITGSERTSSMSSRSDRAGHRSVCAINGDFFSGSGQPINNQVINGEFVQGFTYYRSAFTYSNNGIPGITIPQFSGAVISKDSIDLDISYPINVVNNIRYTDYLVIYNDYYGSTTSANEFGYECLASAISDWVVNDTVLAVIEAAEWGVGHMAIPDGKFVLSGHGNGKIFLQENCAIGDTVKIVQSLANAAEKITQLVGGGPWILKNGVDVTATNTEGITAGFYAVRHPRTGVGYSADSTKAYFMVVDGRQSGLSVGMTCHEMSDFFKTVGAEHAINLDGGGSSAFVVRNSVKNSPSDGSERNVANALLCISSAPNGSFVHLQKSQDSIAVYKNKSMNLAFSGWDEYYNPIGIPDWNDLSVSYDHTLGSFDSNVFTAFEKNGDTYVKADYNGEADSILVHIIELTNLSVYPDTLTLDSVQSVEYAVTATTEGGGSKVFDNALFEFTVLDPSVAEISVDGEIIGKENGETDVIVTYGDQKDTVHVFIQIGSGEVVVDEIESTDDWIISGDSYINMTGTGLVLADRVTATGTKAFQIDYSRTGDEDGNIYLETTPIDVYGVPSDILIDVLSDSIKHWIYVVLEDARGVEYSVKSSSSLRYNDAYRTQYLDMGNMLPADGEQLYPMKVTGIRLRIDDAATTGSLFVDRIRVIYPTWTTIGDTNGMLPSDCCLYQNYPNPFNPTTTLQYSLPEQSDIRLNIFDITGRKIKQWSISNQQPGWHEVIWDGNDMNGNTVSTGVYIYSLQAGDFVDTKKMVFMK